jgi:hypothetical protein
VGPWSARQAAILGGTAAGLWLGWEATRSFVSPLLFLPPAVLVLLLLGVAVSTTRDGVSVDRLLISALRHAAAPRRQVMAPEGVDAPPAFLASVMTGDTKTPVPLELPVDEIDDSGVVGLGRDGASVLASATTVNFALRTPGEQEVLLGGFARWLNALTGPVQIASRTVPADLSSQITGLREQAAGLPHPLLEQAALDHAVFLERLSVSRTLLTRQVVIAAHENDPKAGQRLLRRAHDTAAVLPGAEINVAVLDTDAATDVLAAAFDPDQCTTAISATGGTR